MQTQGAYNDIRREPAVSSDPLAGLKAMLNPEEGWTSFALLAFMTLIAVKVTEDAKWVKEMPSLWGMGLFALVIGYVLAKIKVHSLLLYPVALVIGVIIISWQAVSVSSAVHTSERIVDTMVRMHSFYMLAKEGGISTDPLPFILQILILTWIIGFTSSWLTYRYRLVLLGVLPATIGLIVNLNYLPGRFFLHLAFFLIAAVILIIKITYVQKEQRFRSQGAEFNRTSESTVMLSSVAFGLVSVVLAWNMPFYDGAPLLDTWDRVSGPWRAFESSFDRMFASVSSGRASPLHSFNGSFAFKSTAEASALGNSSALINRYPVFTASTEEPGYWRGESYDVYSGKGWMSSEREPVIVNGDPTLTAKPAGDEYKKRKEVTANLEIGTPGDVIFSRGQPIAASTKTLAQIGKMSSYSVDLKDLRENQRLPSDIRRSAVAIRDSLQGIGGLPSPGQIQRLLPSDVLLEPEGGITLSGREVAKLKVFRAGPKSLDVWSLRTERRQSKYEKYGIVSSISVAASDELREASREYPGWITERYLQLPNSLPGRVKELAEEWTANSPANAYDRAVTIETRLREYLYDIKAPSPPRDKDAVDYFLFDSKRGYADHLSSAMVVLLRSIGIPSRLAVGYVNGDYDSEKDAFEIKEKHAHSWPEVFFPEYGWIEFNPTSSLPTIDRGGEIIPSSGEDEFLEDPLPPFMEEEEMFSNLGADDAIAEPQNSSPLLSLIRPVAGMSLLFIAIALGLYILWTMGLSRLSLAAQGYEKLCRLAIVANLGPKRSQTPSEYGDSLSQQLPTLRRDISAVINTYIRERFGQKTLTSEEKKAYDASWKAIRNALLLKAIRWKTK